MSVRTVRDWSEPLTNAYWSAVNAPTNPEAADRTLALLDAYAHELAEKIRAAEWAENCAQGCCPGDTPEDVANFIDPEGSSDG